MLNDFNILILDEALSEVDMDMEEEIIDAIKKYFAHETLIYVSHKNVEKHFQRVIAIVHPPFIVL